MLVLELKANNMTTSREFKNSKITTGREQGPLRTRNSAVSHSTTVATVPASSYCSCALLLRVLAATYYVLRPRTVCWWILGLGLLCHGRPHTSRTGKILSRPAHNPLPSFLIGVRNSRSCVCGDSEGSEFRFPPGGVCDASDDLVPARTQLQRPSRLVLV